MSRGVHRHRMLRIRSLARIKQETRASNAPAKRSASALRDDRMRSVLKAAKGKDVNPAVVSWVCRQLDKQWRQVTDADLKALAG
jgi:hypothetical protein